MTRVLRPSSAAESASARAPLRARGGLCALPTHDGSIEGMTAFFGFVHGIQAPSPTPFLRRGDAR
ncbi:hypothetical protein SAMN05216486_11528 [bacterium JGI 053]|nr:hypothetical protein SAMN05216486_11528 [bacterium JGI 053]